jgi:hypothetical protein
MRSFMRVVLGRAVSSDRATALGLGGSALALACTLIAEPFEPQNVALETSTPPSQPASADDRSPTAAPEMDGEVPSSERPVPDVANEVSTCARDDASACVPTPSPTDEGAACPGSGCDGGLAGAGSCDDALQNRDETDVDCGGTCAARCAAGQRCESPADCESSVCTPAACAAGEACCEEASCTDGVRNGSEADLDCGGQRSSCRGCADGRSCRQDADCESAVCSLGSCVSCRDGVQNGSETGADCGGDDPTCIPCSSCDEASSVDLGQSGSFSTLAGDACARITQFPGYAPTLLESGRGGAFPISVAWYQTCSGQAGSALLRRPFDQVRLPALGVECTVLIDFSGAADGIEVRWY